ncbi:hypothetical protein ASE70_05710 [Sphingomonas sp. Leaf22]|uniref:GPO family capsid scaffolding protein n=1 Tax=Sphingomonas sp. Leaf22 TaxID=1735687 RepID=UPI0006FD8E02|nr:GPO family capsid scaffolding protein [Sphingomonas sp. Leaf22]KQM79364.1 hypothetical protein ASE70_05710 [Sphingomonas sp. Leaf22]
MAKTRFFRIAVEGGTTDGRVIERAWIEQMAAGYNRATYTASINCEHLRGYSPEPPFNSYGVVDALKTEEIEIDVAGKKEKRLALLASLEPNDQLLAVNRARQKLFTSCEITPNMGGSGKAGLVGLAVTDNPASLGTEMLEFAAGKGDANPFAPRKQDKANLFTAALEADIALDDANDPTGMFASMKAMFDGFASKFAKGDDKPAETTPPAPPAGGTGGKEPANDNFAAFATQLGDTMTQALAAAITPLNATVTSIQTELSALKTKVETTQAPDTFSRKPATGGSGAVLTDC